MAYVLQYTSNFNNEMNQLVEIGIYKNSDNGSGLKGEYYNTQDLSGPIILTRIDPIINFNYPAHPGSPGPGVDEEFTVRWTGKLKAEFTEAYTIYTLNDDGVRVWIDNVLIIDDWAGHGPIENSAVVVLTAGTFYDIVIEYFEGSGEGTMKLSWESASTPKGVIRQRNLFAPLLDVPLNFPCTECKVNVNSDDSEPDDPILTRELVFNINVDINSAIDWQTFIASNTDDWQVIATIDGEYLFHGYLVPDESPAPFQDKPYDITIRCTDGLKLLQKVAITNFDDKEFRGKNTLIEYIGAILSKTNLLLDIRVYCNIYHNSMFVRDSNIKFDMFAQCQLDYRTFMSSSTEFVDCYEALQIMLGKHFRLYYWKGMWIIYRIPEYQFCQSQRYYTDYHVTPASGITPASIDAISGAIDSENYAEIGKTNYIYAIEETQNIASRFANKSSKHTYKYQVWDEIPRNNKFERADIDPFISTPTEKYFTIQDWTFGEVPSPSSLPNLNPTVSHAWRKSTYDIFGVEKEREIQMQIGGTVLALQSDSIPVNTFDKVSVSFQIRLENNIAAGNYPAVMVYIVGSTTGIRYFLDEDSHWKHPGGVVSIAATYPSGGDSSIYNGFSIDSDPIPEDGDMYIAFLTNSLSGSNVYFKDFGFTYTPYVAGGYQPIIGDYWFRNQTNNITDAKEEEVKISDSPKGVLKGALWSGPDNGSLRLLSTEWYRFGLVETRHYKELINIGSFNLTYRRFWKIDGDFNSLGYQANNNSGNTIPLSFTPRYGFMDSGPLRLFVLVCPLEMDIVKGRFSATFIEVYTNTSDGTQEGDSAKFNYLFQ